MMKPRREQLDIDIEEQAADQALIDKVLARMAERDQKSISPKMAERIRETNEYLGIVARVLVAEDSSLKRKFVQQAAKLFPEKATKPRRNLARVIGKIPVLETEAIGKPEPVLDAAAE